MRLFDNLFRKKESAPAAGSPPATAPVGGTEPERGSGLIKVYDKYGRDLFITKEKWRSEILPGALTAKRETAEHIHRIDPVPSRVACLYGVAPMKNHQLDNSPNASHAHTKSRPWS